MRIALNGKMLKLYLEGRVDSSNAAQFEKEIMDAVAQASGAEIVLDASALEYISSAGLRVLMKLRKQAKEALPVLNVSPEVYEILEVTGFTELFDVQKRLREMSVEGLALIGRGANGVVYRLDDERIIKVYNPVSNTLARIQREKQAARAAFIHGIPSAISYEIVRVGDGYGMIYEMVKASTVGEEVARDPESVDAYAHRMAALLKQLHTTSFEPGTLPDAREALYGWADIAGRSGWYADEVIEKLRRFIGSIPPADTFIHGDFHPGNVMVCDGELILIDMGDASVGAPVIDLLGSYQIMKLAAARKDGAQRYTGMSPELLNRFWYIFIRDYTGIGDDEALAAYEKKLKFYALIRTLPGITFSEVIPDEIRPHLVQEVTAAFLRGYEQLERTGMQD